MYISPLDHKAELPQSNHSEGEKRPADNAINEILSKK